MRWSLIYALTRRVLELLTFRVHGEAAMDLELLVLRHEVARHDPDQGNPRPEPQSGFSSPPGVSTGDLSDPRRILSVMGRW
jgi:hypothetical protein